MAAVGVVEGDVAAGDVVEGAVTAAVDGEDDVELEETNYPLRVDYCGLCSMPPEVGL